jgi:hypothetical protein
LLAKPRASIVIAAATREQAGHLYEQARKFVLASPELRNVLKPTRREIRIPSEGRMLVISADAEKQLGWDPDLSSFFKLARVMGASVRTIDHYYGAFIRESEDEVGRCSRTAAHSGEVAATSGEE